MKAVVLKYGIGGAASALSFLFGGMSMLLEVTLILFILDYISGVVASGYEGKISSKTGWKGIAKKFMSLLIICVGHLMDMVLGTQYVQMGILYVLLSNELISIIENAGRTGVKIPAVLQNAVEILKTKGDKKNE